MQPAGANKWTGQVCNAEDGKTYSDSITERDANAIRLEGCARRPHLQGPELDAGESVAARSVAKCGIRAARPLPDCALHYPGYHRLTKPRRSTPVSYDMMNLPTVILGLLIAYAAGGLLTALAFVTFGVMRVLPNPAPVSIPARILLIPGAAALWPYVLTRWLRSRS
jgi:hypothetical protein